MMKLLQTGQWGLTLGQLAGGGGSPLGFVVYEGENTAPSGGVSGDPATARTSFLARLDGGIDVEDFEAWSADEYLCDNYVAGTNTVDVAGTPIVLNGITATMPNPTEFFDPDYYHTYGAADGFSIVIDGIGIDNGARSHYVTDTAGAGRYATSGSHYLHCLALDDADADVVALGVTVVLFALDFSDPIAYFGAYFTDLGDQLGELTVRLTDEAANTYDVPVTHSTAINGTLVFWGFVDDTTAYTKLEFICTRPGSFEQWGMDDVTFGPVGDLV